MNDLEFFISYNPSERVSLRLFTNVGESIVYNEENPATGNNLFIGTFNSFQITPQLTISPSFRYSKLKNKSDDSFYFRGYIARTEINYQFNNTLSFRLIGEFNEFEENFFYQPLLKWNPNPFTIFSFVSVMPSSSESVNLLKAGMQVKYTASLSAKTEKEIPSRVSLKSAEKTVRISATPFPSLSSNLINRSGTSLYQDIGISLEKSSYNLSRSSRVRD